METHAKVFTYIRVNSLKLTLKKWQNTSTRSTVTIIIIQPRMRAISKFFWATFFHLPVIIILLSISKRIQTKVAKFRFKKWSKTFKQSSQKMNGTTSRSITSAAEQIQRSHPLCHTFQTSQREVRRVACIQLDVRVTQVAARGTKSWREQRNLLKSLLSSTTRTMKIKKWSHHLATSTWKKLSISMIRWVNLVILS